MTYSYSNQMQSVSIQNQPSTTATIIAGAGLGAVGGTIVGACKKLPINKHGEATDKFAKQVFEKSSKKEELEIYNQTKNILKKINKTVSADELKKLINTNKKAMSNFCKDLNITLNNYLSKITDKNLKSNKKIIKESLNLTNNLKFQDIKNQIQACWNSAEKKFQKANGVKDEVFKQIKNIKNPSKGKNIAKCAGIGALITGVLAFIATQMQSK